MSSEGPLLESLTRRLADTPAELLAKRDPSAVAVVNDTLVRLGGDPLSAAEARASGSYPDETNRILLIACWLLHDPWFQAKQLAAPARTFLLSQGPLLASVLKAATLVTDPDRREELARLVLDALDLRPKGEDEAQAVDRLSAMSSIERKRVIAKAREAEERAAKIRKEMAEKAAKEAASKISRE